MSVGRNDPCPCGSGKKYKHCCLRADRARRTAHRASRERVQAPEEGSFSSKIAQLRDMAQQAASILPEDQNRELARLLEMADEISAYEEMNDEIEAASLALEDYRAEFTTAMQHDPQAMMERAHALFSEERFARWRWSATDVHRAFEAVGYPQRFEIKEMDDSIETIVAAILHLADSDLRMSLARRLTMLLPEYVAAGRYLDAWLIQYSGFQMGEAPDKSNPFLSVMFQLGYDEWVDQIAGQEEAMIRQLGLDAVQVRDGKMGFADVESWLQEQLADPEKRAAMEAYYADHPMMQEQAQAEALELEKKSVLLLEREDAGSLYLSPEEIAPWLDPLLDRLKPLETRAAQVAVEGRLNDPLIIEEIGQAMVEVSKEMAASVFTPERVQKLAETLKAYRQQLRDANENQAALYAQGGLLLLEHEPNPADNQLLVGTCLYSLRAALSAASQQAAPGNVTPSLDEE